MDKLCVITGASGGIGRETALALGRTMRLVLVCRDRAKADAVADEIERGGSARPEIALADLSSLAEVRAIGRDLAERHPKIDVLVNNAGAMNWKRKVTPDGIEATFATNHLAHFLLTQLLLPSLRAAAPSRIINVASAAHGGARGISFDDLRGDGYFFWRRYAESKLANVLFTYELARRLDGSGVTANCLHPGVVATGFGKNDPGLFKVGVTLARPFLISAAEGARTTIYLATSPDVAGTSGQYFANCKPKRSSRASHDEALQKRLWEVSEKLAGVTF